MENAEDFKDLFIDGICQVKKSLDYDQRMK
jgi:hypothetical protein